MCQIKFFNFIIVKSAEICKNVNFILFELQLSGDSISLRITFFIAYMFCLKFGHYNHTVVDNAQSQFRHWICIIRKMRILKKIYIIVAVFSLSNYK